jgi:hypothetical protein
MTADDDIPAHIYIKFSIDTELDVADGFIASVDKAVVEKWARAEKGKKRDSVAKSAVSPSNDFAALSKEFLSRNDGFIRTAPLVLSLLPMAAKIEQDRLLRRFADERQTAKVVADGYEFYELPIACYREFDKRATTVRSTRQGMSGISDMLLLGLASSFDAFLADLMRVMLTQKPELLAASDKSISLKDLMTIGSVDEARNHLLEREIDQIMRGSHSDQIKWIEGKANTEIRKTNLWPRYVELFERRNIIAHSAGIVSAQYLDVCKQSGYDVGGISVGQKLPITGKYLRKSVDLLTEFGIKLIQVVWRKLKPADMEAAIEKLSETGYELIVSRRYKLAAELLRFGLEDQKPGNDASRKRMIINRANALKLAGKKEDAQAVLDKEDWSAATARYMICVYAVRDDLANVLAMLKSSVDANELVAAEVREWPVFEPLRALPEFAEGFEKVFGEPLVEGRREATTIEGEELNELEASSSSGANAVEKNDGDGDGRLN